MKFQDEKTAFRNLYGDTPKIRVLEYLLEGRELDHSIGDIAKGAGINRITLFTRGLSKGIHGSSRRVAERRRCAR